MLLNTSLFLKLTGTQKSAIITALITGTVLFIVFNIHLTKHEVLISEMFYNMLPEQKAEELEQKKDNEQSDLAKPKTNKAFNETHKNKRFAEAYNIIPPPEDYKNSRLTKAKDRTKDQEALEDKKSKAEDSNFDSEDLSSYNSINNLLKTKTQKKKLSTASNGNNSSNKTGLNAYINKNSSMHYSLTDRTHTYMPTPIYLCEDSGKIIINITVSAAGDVTKTTVNRKASTSKNMCLISSALEYAKKARFNSDASKHSQIGSITFYFEGKN